MKEMIDLVECRTAKTPFGDVGETAQTSPFFFLEMPSSTVVSVCMKMLLMAYLRYEALQTIGIAGAEEVVER
jgi:hypothetical protein